MHVELGIASVEIIDRGTWQRPAPGSILHPACSATRLTVVRSASAKLAVHPLRARWNVNTGNIVTL